MFSKNLFSKEDSTRLTLTEKSPNDISYIFFNYLQVSFAFTSQNEEDYYFCFTDSLKQGGNENKNSTNFNL
jgi:hypothetical protein